MSLQNIANTILVIDDSPADFRLLQQMFERAEIRNPLLHLESAEQALDYLLGRGKFADAKTEKPALILLDVKMPDVDGIELLKTIRGEATLKGLPIIMLTGSNDDRVVLASFEAHADAFLAKPATFTDFLFALQQVRHHAIQIVLTPLS